MNEHANTDDPIEVLLHHAQAMTLPQRAAVNRVLSLVESQRQRIDDLVKLKCPEAPGLAERVRAMAAEFRERAEVQRDAGFEEAATECEIAETATLLALDPGLANNGDEPEPARAAEPEQCGHTPNINGLQCVVRCTLPRGHEGVHEWVPLWKPEPEPAQCGHKPNINGLICALPRGHDGAHVWADESRPGPEPDEPDRLRIVRCIREAARDVEDHCDDCDSELLNGAFQALYEVADELDTARTEPEPAREVDWLKVETSAGMFATVLNQPFGRREALAMIREYHRQTMGE